MNLIKLLRFEPLHYRMHKGIYFHAVKDDETTLSDLLGLKHLPIDQEIKDEDFWNVIIEEIPNE